MKSTWFLGEVVCVFEDAMHLLLTATATVSATETLSKVMNLKTPVVVVDSSTLGPIPHHCFLEQIFLA